MPFFGGRREPSPEPVREPEPTYEEPKKHGFFSRRDPSPPREQYQQPVYEEQPKKHGLFSSRRSTSPSPTTTTRSTDRTSMSSSTFHTANHTDGGSVYRNGSTTRKGFLHRSFGQGNGGFDDDPSVLEARQRVHSAEAAEREADRALDEARASVREAREHVKQLEEEAREEARRAKIKQHQAREVSKLGKALGRHGP